MTRRNHLFTHLALGLSLAAGIASAPATASAQTEVRLHAKIPFAFSANRQSLPAGDYVVAITRGSLLSFQNVETGETRTVMIRRDTWEANTGTARLTFHREAGQTYLTQVWVNRGSLHVELLSHPKPQPEFAKLDPAASTFEIAMK
jgi:hypothetical protein